MMDQYLVIITSCFKSKIYYKTIINIFIPLSYFLKYLCDKKKTILFNII